MKKCPQCQQESLDEAHFCANCGASLDPPPKKLSRQAKRKQMDTKESALQVESSSLSTTSPPQDQEILSGSSQEEDSFEKSREEKKETTTPSKEKTVKSSSQKSQKEEPSSKDKDAQDSKEKQEEKKNKEPKWHSFLFQKKEEENEEEEEDEDVEDHPEDMQRMLFIAVCFLGLLVIFLSGLLIYQDFSSNTPKEGEVVVQNQSSLSLEINSVQKESSASTQSETSEASTKTFSLTHEEGRVLPRRAGEPREESSTSNESSEEKSSTSSSKSSATISSSKASYQANYVMNVRSGPSINKDKVSQIDEGDIVDVDKTQKNSDGSTWGRLEGSEKWVCLFDSDTEYFTEITSQSESSPVAKVDLEDLIVQAGGSVWNLFDDALFIGDSRVYGFMSYGFIPSNQVLAAGGYTIQNISEYLSSVALLQPDVIYLSFGINDMGLNIGQDEGENGYAKVYTRQIEALLERDPGATIVVNSIIDATPSAVANSPRWNKVAEFNRQIKQMCKENDWIYVDNDSLAQGGNAPIYNADGVHLVSTFYEPWAKNMLKARYAQ